MSKYAKHKIKIIFGIGVPLGICMVALQELFQIPRERLWHSYIVGSCIVIFIAVVINCIWQFGFQYKLKKMQRMLYENKELEGYILETNQLLAKVKSNFNRNQLLINLSVAYCENQEYRKAKEILFNIEEKTLSGICKIIYFHDLAYYHFMLNETDFAVDIMNTHKSDFKKWEKHKSLGPCIMVNYIYTCMSQNDFRRAKELLTELEAMNREKSLEESFQLAKKRYEILIKEDENE